MQQKDMHLTGEIIKKENLLKKGVVINIALSNDRTQRAK